MTPAQPQALLTKLLALPAETEWVEFKEAKNDYHFDRLGEYFSALSNEANLKGQEWAWLIFGVKDKPKQVVGSNYRTSRAHLDSLKEEVANQTGNRLTFEEIYEVARPEGRVVMFQIPPALRGVPTAWKGHYYGRDNEAIGPLSLHEIEQIRKQANREDWSAQICAGSSLTDLDPKALAFARQEFKKKHPALAAEVDQWDELTFLNKAKVCINGQVTRTAIILLGKYEAEHFLSPGIAQITWVLKDEHGIEMDYRHFGPPLILAIDQVFAKVRNLTYRYLLDTTLFPIEVTQYDPWVMRETLHNCIAHQDWSKGGRINVVEGPDSLLFTNLGTFLPGSVEEAILRDAPLEHYPNRFLAEAMVKLNMIDTIGSGIKRMFTKQRQRNFPMPDFDLGDPGRVKVRIIGKVIDEKYTRMLMARTDLDLMDVIALDKVQKQKPITDDESKSLKEKKLVEGRRPNLFVSAAIAAATETMVDYLKKRGIDKAYAQKMVVELLKKQGEATRKDFDNLLLGKISDALDDGQKKNFITNLLQEMRRDGIIQPVKGKRGKGARWELCKPSSKHST
jgi:ATP-dependent DNA helicase RecG